MIVGFNEPLRGAYSQPGRKGGLRRRRRRVHAGHPQDRQRRQRRATCSRTSRPSGLPMPWPRTWNEVRSDLVTKEYLDGRFSELEDQVRNQARPGAEPDPGLPCRAFRPARHRNPAEIGGTSGDAASAWPRHVQVRQQLGAPPAPPPRRSWRPRPAASCETPPASADPRSTSGATK